MNIKVKGRKRNRLFWDRSGEFEIECCVDDISCNGLKTGLLDCYRNEHLTHQEKRNPNGGETSNFKLIISIFTMWSLFLHKWVSFFNSSTTWHSVGHVAVTTISEKSAFCPNVFLNKKR